MGYLEDSSRSANVTSFGFLPYSNMLSLDAHPAALEDRCMLLCSRILTALATAVPLLAADPKIAK
ncbi:MAG: hypothetical protein ACRD8O_22310, partial [Bryobacteraceae bacterium]